MLVFCDWPFSNVYFAKNVAAICLFLILGSVFSDCVVFYGDTIRLGTVQHLQCLWASERASSL